MNFDEVGEQFVLLKSRYEKGAISGEEFEQSVRNLVAVAPDGKEWYIDPRSATWVELEKGQSRAVPPQAGANTPETLLQFLLLMGKGLVKSIPRIILIALAISLFTWVAHTYIIAKVNDGLMYNSARVALNSVVHLQQTHFPGVNAFWGLLAYFLTSFFMRSLSLGPQQWFNQIKQTPTNIKQSFGRINERAPGTLILGAFLALLLGAAFRNFMLSWILAIGLLLIMTAHFRGLEINVLKLGISDLQRFFGQNFIPEGEEYHRIYLALLGMVGGFMLAGLLRTNFFITFVFSLLFLATYILLHIKGSKSAVALLLLSGGALLFPQSPVHAWCEGASLSQAGGSWVTWWGSNNADVVRTLGILPALSSFLGGFMGSMVAITAPITDATFAVLAPINAPIAAATAPINSAVNTLFQQGSTDLEPRPAPEDESVSHSQENTEDLPPVLTPAQLEELRNRMTQVIREKSDENYFVTNACPYYIDKAIHNFPIIARTVHWLAGWTGGQCGEFGAWGAEWSKEMINDIVGDDAIISTITVYRNQFANHRGTSVIMPNGEKYVFDYWEGMPNGEARIYLEKEWIDKWKNELGGNSEVTELNDDEMALRTWVRGVGEERAFELFRRRAAENRLSAGQAETIINAFRRDPW